MKRLALPWLINFCSAALVLGPTLAHANDPGNYETGTAAINRIASDLYQALKPEQRRNLRAQPVLLDKVAAPCAQPGEYFDGKGKVQGLYVSAGFVELMNNLSHAKAIDEIEKGYFKKYLASLAAAPGEGPLPALPNVSDTKFWSFDVMNHQVSHFNQMASSILAINLAHHYLGHYKKHAEQLNGADPQTVPIVPGLTSEQWREAVLKGARNALDCGFGVDGLKMLYESLDKLQQRPAWTAYFLPDKPNVSKIKRELDRMERDFFLAGK